MVILLLVIYEENGDAELSAFYLKYGLLHGYSAVARADEIIWGEWGV